MASVAEKLKIVVVWPEWLWRTKQSPARRHYVRAVMHREDVELKVTGPGFPDWDMDRSGSQNVFKIMPDCQVVWGYKLSGTEKTPPVVDDELAKKCVIVENFNECWAGTDPDFPGRMHPGAETVAKECVKAKLTVAIVHHENDRARLQYAEKQGVKVVHIPHCADPGFFDQQRPRGTRHGVVITGVHGQHYPLRNRWLTLIRSKQFKGTIIPRTPNYAKNPDESDKSVRQYANILNSCRVKLGCSSRWKYALNHYVEAAMAGCVQVADMPDDAPPEFKGMFFEVDADAPDGVLIDAVKYASAHADRLGEQAREIAVKHFTTRRYALDFLSAVQSHLK